MLQIYQSMLKAGEDVDKAVKGGKAAKACEAILETQSYEFLPAAEDLQSVIGPEA